MAYEMTETERLLPGGRLRETRRVFAFEAEFASDLRCIPMAVRFKLDRCGIKLSLRQWSKIGKACRFTLSDRPCDTPREVDTYRAELLRLIDTCGAGEAVLLPVEQAPAWAALTTIPDRVVEMIASHGLPPMSLIAWSELSALQRFALLKLTRPGHDNENFLPALREFGLASSGGGMTPQR